MTESTTTPTTTSSQQQDPSMESESQQQQQLPMQKSLQYHIDENHYLLDIRPRDRFQKSHVPKSCNIPWDELKDRMYELPHGYSKLVLIGLYKKHVNFVQDYLVNQCQKSQRSILDSYLEKDLMQNSPELLSEQGNVYYALWDPCVHLKSDIEWIEGILTGKVSDAERIDVQEMGGMTRIMQDSTSQRPITPPLHTTHHYNPGPITDQDREEFKQRLMKQLERKRDRNVNQLSAMDLGCGCGRDVCWLASRGWKRAIGVDNRSWRLKRMIDLAEVMDVKEHVEGFRVNLKRDNILEKHPELENSLDVLTAVRFIHKPLLPELGKLLKDGGLIVYCQFYKGANPPSKIKDILQEGEMRSIFKDWIIWRDEIRPCEDGRPLQWFIAEKPSSSEAE